MKQVRSKAPAVLAAATLVLGLALALSVRMAAARHSSASPGPPPSLAAKSSRSGAPPPGAVPAPRAEPLASLTVPCFECKGSEAWPVRFQTDLDLLAPLGTGSANAALWLRDFSRGGARFEELSSKDYRPELSAEGKSVLSADSPVLREAEAWVDQAMMRFYPDVYAVEGDRTEIPNLLIPRLLARSWVARGKGSQNRELAMEDFRRAIRLGRLLRQDDYLVASDFVGLYCIREGAQAIFDLATATGDSRLALTAAIVLGEVTPQRLRTAERLTKILIIRNETEEKEVLRVLRALPEDELAGLLDAAKGDPDRRFRIAAILQLNSVRFLGTPTQRERALTVLDGLSRSQDPITARLATWSRDTRPHDDASDDS
jgi:hypothetical protein